MHTKKFKEIALQETSLVNQLPDELKNCLLITPVQAGLIIGYAPQTTHNLLSAGKFPIQTVWCGKRKMVRVNDLIEFIENLKPVSPVTVKQPRRPGRPRKEESICREAEKKGVAA